MPLNPAAKSSRGISDRAAGGVSPVIVGVCCAVPVAWIIYSILTTPLAWHALTPPVFHLKLLGRTLLYNCAVAVIATVIALPVALTIGIGRGVLSKLFTMMLPAALLLPSITYSYGWMQVLRVASEHGVIRYPVPGSATDILRCIWTLATWLWPIPAGLIAFSLRRMDNDLQQQALLDGAYWRIVFRHITAPALAAFAVVAVLAMQEFAVYEPTGISVVATEVRTVFETGQVGYQTGAIAGVTTGQMFSLPQADQQSNTASAMMTALPLLLAIAGLSFISRRAMSRHGASDVLDDPAKPSPRGAPVVACVAGGAVFLIVFVFPIAMMIHSIKRPFDADRIWRTFGPPVVGSVIVAGLTAMVAMLATASGLIRRTRFTLALGLVTFLAGGQLLAIALIRLYNHPDVKIGRLIYNGPAIVVMACLARFVWLAVAAGRSTWSPRWQQLRDLAAVDGAGPTATMRWIIWPLAWPLVAASGVLVMLLSMAEVPATVLLNPLRPQVFIPQLMSWVHTLRSDDMLEGSLLLMFLVIALALLLAVLIQLVRLPFRVPATLSMLLILLSLSGCSDSDQPDEVWLETGAGEGQVVYPRAIAYSKSDDSFYVVDRLARIQHLDSKGKFITAWRMPQWTNGRPVGLTVGPDGNLWVPDTHYSRVMVFSPKGDLLKTFGSYGMGKGQFVWVSDIAFDSRGRVFISEFGDHDRIQVFDGNLNYLYEFGKFGSGDGEFSRPQSMVIDGQTLYVTDACNHRISVWTTDGHFIRNMGRIGSAIGEFRFPYGLEMDAKGRLVVCEFGNNRVQLIDKETGKGLKTWGTAGRDPGQLAYPWAVAVDKKNRVVTVDAGNNRLQVFEF